MFRPSLFNIQCETNFNPTIEPNKVTMKKIRAKPADSPKTKIPSNTVPRAPTPVQIAYAVPIGSVCTALARKPILNTVARPHPPLQSYRSAPWVFPKQKVMATSKTPAINNTIQFIVFSLVFIPNYQSEECSAPRFRTTRQRQSLFHNTQTHSSLVRSDHRIKILPTPAGGPPAKAGRGREYRAAWLPPDGRRCRPARAAS